MKENLPSPPDTAIQKKKTFKTNLILLCLTAIAVIGIIFIIWMNLVNAGHNITVKTNNFLLLLAAGGSFTIFLICLFFYFKMKLQERTTLTFIYKIACIISIIFAVLFLFSYYAQAITLFVTDNLMKAFIWIVVGIIAILVISSIYALLKISIKKKNKTDGDEK